jgi:hypothetical protein
VCEFSTRNSHDFLYKRMQNSSTKSTMMADNCNRRTTKLVLAFACHQRLAEWPRTKALDGRPWLWPLPFSHTYVLNPQVKFSSHWNKDQIASLLVIGELVEPKIHGNLGPIYTRSQGQGSTQIKQCYWCKSWNEPQGLYTRSQGWNEKFFSICSKLMINSELYEILAPRLKKDTDRFGKPICNPWGQYSSIYQ